MSPAKHVRLKQPLEESRDMVTQLLGGSIPWKGEKLPLGARLLRRSKMFSLPPTLNPPPARSKYHPTTTQTYPIRQAITTPLSSRMVGDWGLKRPMPPKTRDPSSQPVIRINEVDTIEGITDYSYAMDHTITVRKWAEMDVPIMMPFTTERSRDAELRTVFDDKYDVTAISRLGRDLVNPDGNDRRWRFKGPYLVGMEEAEFTRYLKKQVRPKRAAFREFVRRYMLHLRNEKRRSLILEGTLKGFEAPTIKLESIGDDEVDEYLKKLNQNKLELFRFIRAFLDLPPFGFAQNTPESFYDSIPHSPQPVSLPSPYAMTGPPITHPSAGLFYSLDSNYLENHPVYGPQLDRLPFRAQVINVRHPFGQTAVLGVGGFAHEIYQDFIVRPNRGTDSAQAFHQVNMDIPKLSKVWVTVTGAHITSDGRFKLRVDPVTDASQMVARELIGERRPTDKHKQSRQTDSLLSPRSGPRQYATVTGGRQAYGLQLGM